MPIVGQRVAYHIWLSQGLNLESDRQESNPCDGDSSALRYPKRENFHAMKLPMTVKTGMRDCA